jgi:selenium metabolism protein YedF
MTALEGCRMRKDSPMSERTVDARGMLCPKPLMLVKKALEEVDVGVQLVVLLDNDTACANVTRFLTDNSAKPVTHQDGTLFTIRAEKTESTGASPVTDVYCTPELGRHTDGPLAMVFAANAMGRGSDELGQLLIQACINTLPEMDSGPDVLIFYNSAAQLTIEDSPVLGSLQKLAETGVRILVCGTCADYFDLKDRIRVGQISNMYEILEVLCSASRVIYP